MKQCKKIQIRRFADKEGNLCVIESGVDIELVFKRIFYIADVPKESIRARHANIHSNFLMTAIKGSCKVLVDNGKEKETYLLKDSEEAMFVEKMTWKEMFDFSEDCILMVLSDKEYNPKEYISDYSEFLKLKRSEVEK